MRSASTTRTPSRRVMAGPPATQYNALVTPQADDLRGCRCQYGLPSGVSARLRVLAAVEDRLRQRGGRLGVGDADRHVHQQRQRAAVDPDRRPSPKPQFRHVAGCAPGTVVDARARAARCRCRPTPSIAGADRIADSRCSPTTASTRFALAANGVISGTAAVSGTDGERRRVLQRRARPLLHHLDRGRDGESRCRLRRRPAGPHRSHVQGVRRRAVGDEPGVPLLHSARRSATRTSSAAAPASAARRTQAQPGFVLEDPNYMHVRPADCRHVPERERSRSIACSTTGRTRITATRSTARCATRWWRRAGSRKATGRTAS